MIVLIVLATGAVVVNRMDWRRSLIYIISTSIMAWMGWRDDVRSLPAIFRLTVQGLIAVASIWGMGYFKVVAIPLFGDLQLGIVGILITFLWVIGLTNAYNFMDGIDGMAGGVAFSAALGWMWLSSDTQTSFVFWVALAIAASSLGFLGHNWSPAKVFMGDVGSTFLGYSFAVLSLVSADQGGDALLIGTLLMWIVIMNSFVTFLGRVIKRENVFTGHRSHLFQRLILGGYKHTTISLFYMVLTGVACVLAFLLVTGRSGCSAVDYFGLPSDSGYYCPFMQGDCKVLNNFRNLQSLFWSHGWRWLLFRLGYALRRRTGYLRIQMPQYEWDDRPFETWLKTEIPSTPDTYFKWRKQNSPKFFFRAPEEHRDYSERSRSAGGGVVETRIPGDMPWNPQTAVEEAERILSGEFKYFSHTYYHVGFPPGLA